MPSFDIISEFDSHQLTNAVDQANREVSTRFDFKGSNARFERQEVSIILKAESAFQLQQMLSILYSKMTKRGIDVACMESSMPQTMGKTAQQTIILKQGLDTSLSKKIVKWIKDKKMKVQASIQGDKVRVNGKKRNDLQQLIKLLKDNDWGQPLQFDNFRD